MLPPAVRVERRLVVEARVKTAASALRKMLGSANTKAVRDVLGLRVVVLGARADEDAHHSSLYAVRDALHCLGNELKHRSKDYVQAPKPSGYRSLHSTLSKLSMPTFKVHPGDQHSHQNRCQTEFFSNLAYGRPPTVQPKAASNAGIRNADHYWRVVKDAPGHDNWKLYSPSKTNARGARRIGWSVNRRGKRTFEARRNPLWPDRRKLVHGKIRGLPPPLTSSKMNSRTLHSHVSNALVAINLF